MKPDDLAIRYLGKKFELLDWARRGLDQSADDVTRADIDTQWLDIAQKVFIYEAGTRLTLRTKARVLLALIDATGSIGAVANAARSMAADVLTPNRFG